MKCKSGTIHRQVLRVATLALIALTACACSERRSTEPSSPPEPPEPAVSTKLPAMDITESPIAAASDTLWGFSRKNLEFGTEYFFTISDSLLQEIKRIDEICLRYTGPWSAEIWVYNVVESTWQALDQGLWDSPKTSLPWPHYQRLLSQLKVPLTGSLIDDHGLLHVASRDIRAPALQLLRYHDDYETVALPGWDRPLGLPPCQAQIISVDGALWIVPTVRRHSIRWYYPCDMFYVVNTAGQPVCASDFDGTHVAAVTYGDSAVWTSGRFFRGVYEVSTMNSAGVLTKRFNFFGSSRPDMTPPYYNHDFLAWGFNRLWVRDPWKNILRGIPKWEIAERDHPDHDWRFGFRPLPPRAVISGVTCDGSFFYVQWHEKPSWAGIIPENTITKVNLSGQAVGVYPVPVRSTGAMAWDGEAMWLVHTGPLDFESPALMLSRFYLP